MVLWLLLLRLLLLLLMHLQGDDRVKMIDNLNNSLAGNY